MLKKIFGNRKKSREGVSALRERLDMAKMPQHIAVIMDGNGRWAQNKGMMRTFGHRAGGTTLKKIVRESLNLGIKAITAYAFSTENWKRPHEEVDFLMELFSEYLAKEIDELCKEEVRIIFIGDLTGLSEKLRREFEDAEMRTAKNSRLILNLAVNYGSRDEITRAVKKIAAKVSKGELSGDAIDMKVIDSSLDTAASPPLDLIIRTGGDFRISNFLLWQAAYAEFWFTDVNWPDFAPEHLWQAIYDYQSRDRRFGGIKKK
jgi:undecaprenyl diphosphate synthase